MTPFPPGVEVAATPAQSRALFAAMACHFDGFARLQDAAGLLGCQVHNVAGLFGKLCDAGLMEKPTMPGGRGAHYRIPRNLKFERA